MRRVARAERMDARGDRGKGTKGAGAKRIGKKRKNDDGRFAIIRQLPVMMQAMSSSSLRGGGEMEMEGLFGRKGESKQSKGRRGPVTFWVTLPVLFSAGGRFSEGDGPSRAGASLDPWAAGSQ